MKKLVSRKMRALFGVRSRKDAGAAQEPHQEGSRTLARWGREEDGNAIVEFALTAPILIAVLMAIFEFGIAFYNQLTLTQAVGSGAQYLQTLTSSGTTDPCASTLTAIENSAPLLVPASLSLTVSINGTQVGGKTCSGDQSDLAQGVPVTVSATYPCNITIFGINLNGLSKWSFNCNLSAQVTEYEY
jgi:Flp pilus assembly protein TadG